MKEEDIQKILQIYENLQAYTVLTIIFHYIAQKITMLKIFK